jgi:hypothetical protein
MRGGRAQRQQQALPKSRSLADSEHSCHILSEHLPPPRAQTCDPLQCNGVLVSPTPLRRINAKRQDKGSPGKLSKILHRPPFDWNKASDLLRILSPMYRPPLDQCKALHSRPLLPSPRFLYPNCGEKVRVSTAVSVHAEACTALFYCAGPVPAVNDPGFSALF